MWIHGSPAAAHRAFVRVLGATCMAVVLLLGACTGDDADESTAPPANEDDRGERSDPGDLTSFVLAEQSVSSIAGFEDVVARPLSDAGVIENPDPRGPCGGESPPPPVEGTAGAVFGAPGISIVQVVAEGPDVDRFVEAQLADIDEPCGPYESTANVETAQRVDRIEIVELPDELGYYLTARIVGTAQTAFSGSGLIRSPAGVTSLVFAVSAEPVRLESMESLIRLVDAELNSG